MAERYPSTTKKSAKDAVYTQPVPPVSPETGANHATRSGTVGVYDRPESASSSWLSIAMVLFAVVIVGFILAVYFFMS